MVSGIYITEVKSIRGKKKTAQEEPKKKSFGAKMRKKQRELQAEYAKEEKVFVNDQHGRLLCSLLHLLLL